MIQRDEEILQVSEGNWLSITRDNCSKTPLATVVLCHGLTGDKIGPQKLLSELSRYLASHCNVNVVRFDFRGSGLSSGSFVNTCLISMQEDAIWIGDQIDTPIIWMGISTGAVVSLMAAAKRGKNEKVFAISNGFSESLDCFLFESDPVSLRDGQLFLSKDYFLQRSLLCFRKDYFPKVGVITVILGSDDKKHFSESQRLQKAGIEVIEIGGGDHLFTNPEKRKQLFVHLKGKIRETS